MDDAAVAAVGSPAHVERFDGADPCQPSSAVIEALATVTDSDPLELEPLYDTIDVEALDRLFEHQVRRGLSPSLTISTVIDDWQLVLTDGAVRVYVRD